MKKLFTAIRQGKIEEVKSIIERKPELVNCVSGPLPKKDHGQSPLQVAFKTGKYEIADYVAWANRGHYAEPYPGESNKSMFLDEFVPVNETHVDENKHMRAFMQDYFRSRNLVV